MRLKPSRYAKFRSWLAVHNLLFSFLLFFTKQMQPTLAMMVGAAVQARHPERYGGSGKGIRLLHPSLDEWILQEFNQMSNT